MAKEKATKEVTNVDQLHSYSVRKNFEALMPSSKVTKLSMDIIQTIQNHHVNYDEAKEALDYANQVLLNKLLNKTTI